MKRSTGCRYGATLAALVLCATVPLVFGYENMATAPTASVKLAANAEVLETMDVGSYTYVRVKPEDSGEIWAAGPRTEVKVGDRVDIATGALMKAFESKSLDRTFDEIYFVGSIEVLAGSGAAEVAPAHLRTVVEISPDVGSIRKADDGFSIAELFTKRDQLAGEQVTVRGKVVKFTDGIMGRNWVHIQDGTGEAGTNDLTVTTQDAVNVGDVVLVQGTATVDKDFGAGYRYDLIIEQASVNRVSPED